MSESPQRSMLAGPAIMLLSAAIFGYFGFATSFIHHSAITGKLLLYVPILEWTLKVSAIAFLVSGILTFVTPVGGNLLYSVVGILSAVGFLVVAVMDVADTQHQVMSPLLLIVFAAWNGYGSWIGLSAVLSAQRSRASTLDGAERQ
jgi:hypothetical protein